MSNRLEQEFPEVSWRALPPIGPGGVSPEVMRQCLQRGRELRNEAMRNSFRAGGAAVVRAVGALMALIRCSGQAARRARPGRPGALRVTVAPHASFIPADAGANRRRPAACC